MLTSNTIHRTLFNNFESESKFNIKFNSNYNSNFNSKNELESVKKEPQPYQSDKIAVPPQHHFLMDLNFTLNH